ncbi:hypothetical protein FQN49_006928 [Arthroderma sp. PD_2]|nr:hypothetical protein FQN49_006928 [Arthroderma sp. PD_2]
MDSTKAHLGDSPKDQPDQLSRFQLKLNKRIEKLLAGRKALGASQLPSTELNDGDNIPSPEYTKEILINSTPEDENGTIKPEDEDNNDISTQGAALPDLEPNSELEFYPRPEQPVQPPAQPLEQPLEYQQGQRLEQLPEKGPELAVASTGAFSSNRMGAPSSTQGPPPKRLKKSIPLEDELVCSCSMSTECEVAAANGVKDCRANSQPVIRKGFDKSKGTGATRHEYISKRRQNEITRSNREILEILALIKKIETIKAPNDLEKPISRLRERVHYLEFYEVPPPSIESIKAKFTDPERGLPAIIRNHKIPWDIRLDYGASLQRIKNDDFEVDLLRGIVTRRTHKDGGRSGISRSINKDYKFKYSSNFIGEGHLRNGQWFPWQICAIRDGAHGDIEAGISGSKQLGAVSIILSSLSGNHAYADVDKGDTIWYCGTRSKDGKATANTAHLLKSARNKTDIRVLRSAKLPRQNPYRPVEGIRYDGLYKICDYEILDEKMALHRFKLERVPGQTPIRYQGPEIRPSRREIEELEKMNNHIAKTRPVKELKRKRVC